MDLEKTVDAIFKRKKLLGLALLAVAAVLWIKGDQGLVNFLGVAVAPLAFFLAMAGVVLIVVKMRRRGTHD